MKGKCSICNEYKEVKDYSYLNSLIAPIAKTELEEILYCEECLENFKKMVDIVKKDWKKDE